MSIAPSFGKKEEVYGFQTLYREIGYYILRLEQYERALKFFNEAVQKTPHDRRTLLGRAWARSKATQYEGALEDIRTALHLDADDLTLLAPKALNTYLSCEFEDGLVQNTRLVPRRTKPDHFSMGVMHCTEAIDNCLGENAGRPLRDHFKIIRKLAWKEYFETLKPFEPKSKYKRKKKKEKKSDKEIIKGRKIIEKKKRVRSKQEYLMEGTDSNTELDTKQQGRQKSFGDKSDSEIRHSLYSAKSDKNIIPPGESYPFKPLQNYTTNIKNYMAEKYLDCMYLDKSFLENLIKQPGVRSINKSGTKKMLQAASNGHKLLCYKQELLRTRRPFYYLKYQEANVSGALKARQTAAEEKLREAASRDAENLKAKLEEALKEKRLRTVIDVAEKLKQFCESKPKRILPNRDKYLTLLYDSVCQAHYDAKRINPDQPVIDQKKRIYVSFGIDLSREPSADSVIEQYKDVFLDWKKLVGIYEDRLANSTSSEEMAWLFHELSRFYSELKQYEMSRVYARKCISEAIALNNPKWVVNASMLITKVNIGQQNRNDAKLEVKKTIEVAKEIQDNRLLEYLEKCLDVIDNIEFDDLHGPKILERREKKIIDMMGTSNLKSEAAHLFSMMQAMPAHRRMNIMPGVKTGSKDEAKERSVKKQSIMPSSKSGSAEDMSTPVVPGNKRKPRKRLLTLEEGDGEARASTRGGVGFMDLIDLHMD